MQPPSEAGALEARGESLVPVCTEGLVFVGTLIQQGNSIFPHLIYLGPQPIVQCCCLSSEQDGLYPYFTVPRASYL